MSFIKIPKIDTLNALGDAIRYAQDTPKICPRYAQNMPKICPWYAQDMPKDMTKSRKHQSLTYWLSNMGPRDASAAKKVIFEVWRWELVTWGNL